MPTKYTNLRDKALADLKNYMDSLDESKGTKLAYWIADYTSFLKQESSFRPEKLLRYKRGAIVKVDLGYRVGSEQGGLHYAIVMDNNNSIYSPTVTVIPLTSVKPRVDLSKLHPSRVYIGNEVYSILTANHNAEIRSAKQHLNEIKKLIDSSRGTTDENNILLKQLTELEKQVDYCEKMKKEANRMKQGSIALIGQITTISKIRIFDPKYPNDALSKVRITTPTLDLLDAKIQELFGAHTKERADTLTPV